MTFAVKSQFTAKEQEIPWSLEPWAEIHTQCRPTPSSAPSKAPALKDSGFTGFFDGEEVKRTLSWGGFKVGGYCIGKLVIKQSCLINLT